MLRSCSKNISSPNMLNGVLLSLCVVFGGVKDVFGYGIIPDLSQGMSVVPGQASDIPDMVANLVTMLSDVNKRLQLMERSYQDCNTQITAMKTEIKDVKTENRQLKENINVITDFLRAKGLDLDRVLSKHQTQFVETDKNAEDLENPSFGLNAPGDATRQSDAQNVTYKRLRRVPSLNNRPSIRAGSVGDNVAFHAVLSRDLVNPGKGYEVVYGSVLTNTGGMYSSNTGTFTCGTPGTYVFLWTVTLASDHWTDTNLVRNGQVIGILVAGNAYHYGSYTGTVIAHLDVGDEVFVKVDFHQDNTTIYSTASTFSGYKLF